MCHSPESRVGWMFLHPPFLFADEFRIMWDSHLFLHDASLPRKPLCTIMWDSHLFLHDASLPRKPLCTKTETETQTPSPILPLPPIICHSRAGGNPDPTKTHRRPPSPTPAEAHLPQAPDHTIPHLPPFAPFATFCSIPAFCILPFATFILHCLLSSPASSTSPPLCGKRTPRRSLPARKNKEGPTRIGPCGRKSVSFRSLK